MPATHEPGYWRRKLRGLRSTDAELEADELRSACLGSGGTPIAQCHVGEQVTLSGRLRSVTLCPVTGQPEVQAELYDGSGRVKLVWLGRRRITGVTAGREMVVVGRLTALDGEPTIYNPEYCLRPVAAGG